MIEEPGEELPQEAASDDPPEGCEPEEETDWVVALDHFRLLSVNVNVRSCDEEFSEALRWQLEPFRHHKAEPESVSIDLYPLDEDAQRPDRWFSFHHLGTEPRSGPLSDLLNHALWYVHALVPKRAGDFLFLHSGAVARDGRAMLLPAARDTGKSTTVAALLEAGFDYLSDELGAIDQLPGRAYPYPKRISLGEESLAFFDGLGSRLRDRDGAGRWLYQRYVRPEDLGAHVAPAVPIGDIVFLSPDHQGPPMLTPVPQAEAVREMAAHCFNLYRYEARGVLLLSRVASEARAHRLAGGTPRERAAMLRDLTRG